MSPPLTHREPQDTEAHCMLIEHPAAHPFAPPATWPAGSRLAGCLFFGKTDVRNAAAVLCGNSGRSANSAFRDFPHLSGLAWWCINLTRNGVLTVEFGVKFPGRMRGTDVSKNLFEASESRLCRLRLSPVAVRIHANPCLGFAWGISAFGCEQVVSGSVLFYGLPICLRLSYPQRAHSTVLASSLRPLL